MLWVCEREALDDALERGSVARGCAGRSACKEGNGARHVQIHGTGRWGQGTGGGVVRADVCFLDPGSVNSRLYNPFRVTASSAAQPSLDVLRPREPKFGA